MKTGFDRKLGLVIENFGQEIARILRGATLGELLELGRESVPKPALKSPTKKSKKKVVKKPTKNKKKVKQAEGSKPAGKQPDLTRAVNTLVGLNKFTAANLSKVNIKTVGDVVRHGSALLEALLSKPQVAKLKKSLSHLDPPVELPVNSSITK